MDGNDVDSGADSREQLERDIDVWLDSMTGWSIPARTIKQDIIGWLDRQEAITTRQLSDSQIIKECKDWERWCKNAEKANRVLWQQVDNLRAENDALMAAHADDVERLDSMGEGELMRKLDELKEELIAEREAFEACKGCKLTDELRAEIARLKAERDLFEHDLSETEAKFAKEMAETLSLHSKQQAASHQAWVDAVDERDYWKQEVQYCMNAAYPPSHAPERPYNPHVMDYPPSDAYTNPSTMVSAVIDGLRDEKAAEWMGALKQLKETQAERDRYRELASELLDAAHNMQLIADRGLA